MSYLPDTATDTVRGLLAEHAALVARLESASDRLDNRAASDTTRGALDVERADVLARLAALDVEITDAVERRGGLPRDVASQSLLTVGPRDALRSTDVESRLPDALDGSRHRVKRGHNKRGATALVQRRGTATVQGGTAWNVDALAAHIGDRAADVAAFLASDRLAAVRRLTLGASALDVERAADAILAALDVEPLDGTDVTAWHRIETLDRVETPADADAMTVAILAGETLDSLVSLSRHRAGITGYLAGDGPACDLSTVTAARRRAVRRADVERTPNAVTVVRPAASAWRDHGLDPRQITPRRLTIAQVADRTVPTVETAGWPTGGPRSARPRVPVLRKVERLDVERVTTDVERGRGRAAHYWRAVAADVPRVTYFDDGTAVVTPAADVERLLGVSPRPRGRNDKPRCATVPRWSHAADAVCDACEHHTAVNAAAERLHIGIATVDRGQRSTAGTQRPTSSAARAAVAQAAATRAAGIPTVTVATASDVAAHVAALDRGDAVKFTDGTHTVRLTFQRGGRYDARLDGIRIGQPATARRALDLVASVLDVETDDNYRRAAAMQAAAAATNGQPTIGDYVAACAALDVE